jgi:hypothetical protein
MFADPEMQSHIEACISSGRADFEVFVLVCLKMIIYPINMSMLISS